ncbi:MlaE family ABC transporter permease [Campylobacter fetus]|uniref:ABC transporter permease n=1 Tax=Campylobacter fetus subsp. testudinum TaxID=1507806 RepID=A0AAX0H963_CAMFE|nr:ABC transporter permease [Campylobacter fetus]AJB45115.1 ABC transporter permease [Campylobacter fetus subsp. testudinum]ALV64463.1 lipid asymmetry ABC transporter MlaABCDEF, permease component MlaE [Campylobacter fetus subsp. testudinum Sp3]AVK80792.1 ABC transporter permease [Campylobacter fetus subsp. testudinum]EAK0830875.1 ABC transporter permease [Campylobacter fetus]MPB71748.1 ABC transporter permease [Campylobacter fetus]
MKKYNFTLDNTVLKLDGEFDYTMDKKSLKELKSLKVDTLDLKNLIRIDYSAATFFAKHYNCPKLINSNDKFDKIFALVGDKHILNLQIIKFKKSNLIEQIGKNIINLKNELVSFCIFLGEFLFNLAKSLLNPFNIRFKELSNHFYSAGISAVFIVCLTSFLIGIVLAYQGATMLENFGASIYVVDIMGIMTLREVGPLIAAIVVAGRSASSYTAQIGVMKITDELEAMKTMGFEPFRFIVMPRVLALILAMPFIVFLANAVSVFGQMMVCNWYLDLSFSDYLERFRSSIVLRHFWVGLFKAPFFGAIIALIGCKRGFEVSGSTDSVGELTTRSVVNALFWIIALDAVFSVIYTELDI